MRLTEYGKLVRKARIDANITMLKMADALGVSPSYLSALENGKKKVPTQFVGKVLEYFREVGVDVPGLFEATAVSNEQVSIAGLSLAQQIFISSLARTALTAKQIDDLAEKLAEIRK